MSARKLKYSLRKATDRDYPFVERLYIETQEPLLNAFDAWDLDRNIALFNKTYRVAEAKIIVVGEVDAGWLQIHECERGISLHQIHIEPDFRNRAIGTRIIKDLIHGAERRGKKLTLSVVRNNRALNLYQRLGFKIVDEDETKLHLSR